MTALMTAVIFLVAPWIGDLYGEEKLASFLQITAVAGLIEAVSLPILGLLRRDMAFGAVACIQTASATVTAMATAWFAFAGFSYMSYAWASVAAAGASTVLAFYFRPDLSILRPAFKSWGNVLTFGGYNGASFVINRVYESLPSLVLGYLLPHAAVGLYNRASVVSDIPDKVVLTSVFSVAFPALAAEVREGRSLKEPYLRALGLITVLYWPAQLLLALLAYPVAMLLLGPQWLGGVVPLLQLMAIAGLAWFPVTLTSPVLLAVAANRDRVLADLVGRSLSAVVLCSAAYFGVLVMAASKLVTEHLDAGWHLVHLEIDVPPKLGQGAAHPVAGDAAADRIDLRRQSEDRVADAGLIQAFAQGCGRHHVRLRRKTGQDHATTAAAAAFLGAGRGPRRRSASRVPSRMSTLMWLIRW
jgi:lipopolysaccharide exporter